jgi:O-antigen/teichoic acid export membrane protein
MLAGKGNTHRGATFAFAGGVMTLASCALLVPAFGIVGAAVAALLGTSQAAIFELWAHGEAQAMHRLDRFRLRRTATALVVAAGGAAAAATIVSFAMATGWPALFVAAFAASAAFVSLWFGLGLAAREERVLLGRAVRVLRKRCR